MTVSDTNSTEARPGSFTVLGRTIRVKPMETLTDGQRLGFVKIFRRCMTEGLDGASTVKLDQALSKLLTPEDNDWLDYQIMEDRLKWLEVLMELMGCLRGVDPPEPEVAKKAPRARKAAAKKAAPAKKAAKRA